MTPGRAALRANGPLAPTDASSAGALPREGALPRAPNHLGSGSSPFFPSRREGKDVGLYDTVLWRLPPPFVSIAKRSADGVGLLVQTGHASVDGVQEAIVPGPNFDVFATYLGRSGHTLQGTFGDETLYFKPGQAVGVYWPAGLAVRWIAQPTRNPCLQVHLPKPFREELAMEHQLKAGDLRAAVRGGRHHMVAQYILKAIEDGTPLTSLAIDAAALMFLDSLEEVHHRSAPLRGGLAPWQLRRVTEKLSASLAGNPTLAELAHEVRLSPFHFARAFRTTVGIPPHRYLLELRLQRAKELLEHTDLSLTQIAADVGYDDSGQLSRLFRQSLGLSPNQYRRNRKV